MLLFKMKQVGAERSFVKRQERSATSFITSMRVKSSFILSQKENDRNQRRPDQMETLSEIRFLALELNCYKMTNESSERFISYLSKRPSNRGHIMMLDRIQSLNHESEASFHKVMSVCRSRLCSCSFIPECTVCVSVSGLNCDLT